MLHACSTNRLQMRSCRGATIAEFPLALFVFLLFAFFPATNVVLFLPAQFGLQWLSSRCVQQLAMSDTTGQAESKSQELLKSFNNPILTMFHTVKIKSNPAGNAFSLAVEVRDMSGMAESYDIRHKLPQMRQPHFKDNATKLSYLYHLSVPCTVYPVFNLSGIPVIGQVPMVGGPVDMTLSAEAPVENLGSLDGE